MPLATTEGARFPRKRGYSVNRMGSSSARKLRIAQNNNSHVLLDTRVSPGKWFATSPSTVAAGAQCDATLEGEGLKPEGWLSKGVNKC